jgi:molybdenum-dependent DNA-binding transcriptional regulator ModE
VGGFEDRADQVWVVIDYVDRVLEEILWSAAGGSQGGSEVAERLSSLGDRITRANETAVPRRRPNRAQGAAAGSP